MIPIENFPATTFVDGVDGPYTCTVVGIVRAGDGFDFVVVVDDDDERWIAQRQTVTAPDGETLRPH